MNSGEVPIRFSEKALAVLEEIESLYGSEVYWQEYPGLDGAMCAVVKSPLPLVRYRSLADVTEEGCVHELFHLKLRKRGFPCVEKVDPDENNDWRDQTVAMLNNLFQHAVVFPELVRLGYLPFQAEEIGTRSQVEKLQSVNFPSPTTSNSLRSLLALLYARSHLDCGSPEIRELSRSVFEQNVFSDAKAKGLAVIEIVRQYGKDDIPMFREGLLNAITLLEENAFLTIGSPNGA
jgi:hypothetical protein